MLKYLTAEVKNHREQFPEFIWEHEHDLVFKMETVGEYLARMEDFHKSLRHEKLVIVSHGTPVNTIYEFSIGLPPGADTVNFVRNCAISYSRNGQGVWFGKVVYDE
jgi:broad specificity phosphatase PhoE